MTPTERLNNFRTKLAEWRANWHRATERAALAQELVAMMEANPTLKLVPPWDVLDLIFAHADGS